MSDTFAAARILVVDDDDQLRRVMTRELEEVGHSCAAAADAAEARTLLARESIDVMLCDVHMPGESGMSLLREVLADHKDVATVMISGLDDPEFAETALGLGAYGYMVKPVRPAELVISVSNALRRLRLEREGKEATGSVEDELERRTGELSAERDARLLAEATADAERLKLAEVSEQLGVLTQRYELLERRSAAERTLLQAGTPDTLFDTIAAGAQQVSGRDVAIVGVPDPDADGFTLTLGSDGVELDPGEAAGVAGQGALGKVIENASELVASADELGPVLARAGAQSALALPLRHNGELVGGLVVGSRDAAAAFGEPERDALRAFAASAAAAIATSGAVDVVEESLRDDATGFPNRTRLLQKLHQAILASDTGEAPVAVLATSLDPLHRGAKGLEERPLDTMRAAFAERIEKLLREGDTIARAAAGEFLVVLANHVSRADPEGFAGRIVQATEKPFMVDDRSFKLTASVGVAYGDGQPATLLQQAEIALFRARRAGGARWLQHSHGMRATLRSSEALESELAEADPTDFKAFYEPVVSFQGRELRALELVPRWQNPSRGLVSRGLYSPLAEEIGVVEAISEPLLQEACEQVASWGNDFRGDRPLSLSVNITATELRGDSLVQRLRRTLDTSGLHPHNLILEVDELVLLLHGEEIADRLGELKDLGVRLAIDDFGASNVSLHALGRLPFEIVKLGRSLIDGIGHGLEEASLARNVVELANSYELQVIAQGVERTRQVAELDGMGCRLGQGYYFSQPLDRHGMTALMHRAKAGYGRLGAHRGQDLRLDG